MGAHLSRWMNDKWEKKGEKIRRANQELTQENVSPEALVRLPDKEVVSTVKCLPVPAWVHRGPYLEKYNKWVWMNISTVAFPVFSQIWCWFPWRWFWQRRLRAEAKNENHIAQEFAGSLGSAYMLLALLLHSLFSNPELCTQESGTLILPRNVFPVFTRWYFRRFQLILWVEETAGTVFMGMFPGVGR